MDSWTVGVTVAMLVIEWVNVMVEKMDAHWAGDLARR
jgi:hypothetical protein